MISENIIVGVNDLIIAICYFIIPFSSYYIVRKEPIKIILNNNYYRQEQFIFFAFVYSVIGFIFSCGLTHLFHFISLFFLDISLFIVLNTLCSFMSLITVLIILFKGKRIVHLLTKIEITQKGATSDLKKAFNIAIDWSVDMVSINDYNDLKFLQVNKSCNSFGYSEDMLLGVSLLDIINEDDKEIILKMQSNFINAEKTYRHSSFDLDELNEEINPYENFHLHNSLLIDEEFFFTYRLKTSDNRNIYVESSCQLGKLDNETVLFIITRNIQKRIEKFDHEIFTQNEQIRIETTRNQAMLLAHDFRTPLSIFELGINSIQQQNITESMHNIILTISSALTFMKFVINRIIDSSRVLQGETPVPKYDTINIKDLIDNCLLMMQEYPKCVEIKVLYHYDFSTIIFVSDNEWLWSIIINLLTNACDNTMFGSIQLHIKYEENLNNTNLPCICIEVHDTGCGIDSKDKDKLFYPFVLLSSNKSKKGPKHGIGIGLYNCAWRTRYLNGTYKYESNPGGGSIFIINIPLNNKSLIKVKSRLNIIGLPSIIDEYKNIKILLVEDTKSFRMLFKRQLRNHGFKNIDEADNGKIGLEMLKTTHYDIAFIDFYMPLKNGDECITEYRSYENENGLFPRTKCILVTADNISKTSNLIINNIIDTVVNKPVDIKEIISIIYDLIQP
jgi:signal transduction histidine kinase/ActR/RegA family two-component response regulator